MKRKAALEVHWMKATLAGLALAALAVGCGGSSSTPPVPVSGHLPKHVIVVVMENRTVDNLFQFLPGADTASTGRTSTGGTVSLAQTSLNAMFDPDHSHGGGFLTEFNNGNVNGFDQAFSQCSYVPPYGSHICEQNLYAFVPQQEVAPYYALAQAYAFADHVFQTNQGPSYPAHQYLVAAQSGHPLAIAENPGPDVNGGCNSRVPGESVAAIDMTRPFPSNENAHIFPCLDFPTIFDLLDQHGVSWKYYTPATLSLWNAINQIKHLYANPAVLAHVILNETKIFNDVKAGNLAGVSYVIPHPPWSDHPRDMCTNLPNGPDFVGALVDAVGQSPYWDSTAIIVTWDDWGGWFDHVKPVPPLKLPTDPYEYGFRVPMLVVSPYARPNYIDSGFRDFTSVLHFIEDVYKLGPIAPGSLEQQTDDLFNLFQFNAATPRPFQAVTTAHSPAYWAAFPSPLPHCNTPQPLPTPSGGVPSGTPPADQYPE
jgi:phospholipase C